MRLFFPDAPADAGRIKETPGRTQLVSYERFANVLNALRDTQ